MRKIYLIVVLITTLFYPGSLFAEPPIEITVSIPPQKYFVEKIGGDAVQVRVLIKPGTDPHTFEPSPRQMLELSQSQIFFQAGVDFEYGWFSKFEKMNPRLKIVGKKQGEDLHFWLSPKLVKSEAKKILNILKEYFPERIDLLEENYELFLLELDSLDKTLREIFHRERTKSHFLVAHSAWSLFARDYTLQEVALSQGEKEPSPRDLKIIIEKAKTWGLNTVFIDPAETPKSVSTIAKSLDAKIVAIDPLAGNWNKNLIEVANKIADSLQ